MKGNRKRIQRRKDKGKKEMKKNGGRAQEWREGHQEGKILTQTRKEKNKEGIHMEQMEISLKERMKLDRRQINRKGKQRTENHSDSHSKCCQVMRTEHF